MNSATDGKAELALPTLAIAQVPVAELPVRDRLLLWENSQLVQFRVQKTATSTRPNQPCLGKAGFSEPDGFSVASLSFVMLFFDNVKYADASK